MGSSAQSFAKILQECSHPVVGGAQGCRARTASSKTVIAEHLVLHLSSVDSSCCHLWCTPQRGHCYGMALKKIKRRANISMEQCLGGPDYSNLCGFTQLLVEKKLLFQELDFEICCDTYLLKYFPIWVLYRDIVEFIFHMSLHRNLASLFCPFACFHETWKHTIADGDGDVAVSETELRIVH